MDVREAAKLATEQIRHYLPDWSFRWDNAKTRFGVCDYRRRTIGLSRALTAHADPLDVLDTILHEIAHGLTPGHRHDATWQSKALSIGANGQRCSKQTKGMSYKYAGWCSVCHKLVTLKHRKSRAMKYQRSYHVDCGMGSRIQYLANAAEHTIQDVEKVKRVPDVS